MSCGCGGGTDPRALVREGTHQGRRALPALDPSHVPVDERRPEHAMVFAARYAAYLPYVGLDNAPEPGRTWAEFFASGVTARLAVAAVEDVATYRTTVTDHLRPLQNPEPTASGADLIASLAAVFDCLATLALRLDELKAGLPGDHALRATLSNLVRARLSPALRQLIGYHLAGRELSVVDPAAPPIDAQVLGGPLLSFAALLTDHRLSLDWYEGSDWEAYKSIGDLTPYRSAYGTGATVVDHINHLGTHNLFTAVCETFLGGFARVVEDARAALRARFAESGHAPHYALFLAFLQLFEYARAEANTLTQQHLDFYYRRVLRLAERPAEPGRARVLVQLARQATTHLVPAGTRLRAGKDDSGADAFFTVDRDLVANQGAVAELRSLYRHRNTTESETLPNVDGWIFARTVTGTGEPWHPFAAKTYADGSLTAIDMPPADVGFAIASHYLWLAEGERTIDVVVKTAEPFGTDRTVDLTCQLTTEKGWLSTPATSLEPPAKGEPDPATTARLRVVVGRDAPAITPYAAKVHGGAFDTALPMLVVRVRHRSDAPWGSANLRAVTVEAITLRVAVKEMRTLAVSTDSGPVDTATPFPAYGAAPAANSALVIGSKEVFQKELDTLTVDTTWMAKPFAFTRSATDPIPVVQPEYLTGGRWAPLEFLPTPPELPMRKSAAVDDTTYLFSLATVGPPPVTVPDLTADVPYSTVSRHGFVRLRLSAGFGTDAYPAALAAYLLGRRKRVPTAPVVPVARSLTLSYTATQKIALQTSDDPARGRFFHVTPFGHAEPRTAAPLVPRFLAGPDEPADGELYIGVRSLAPPQNLALLFQVADGTADPLVVKPENHLRWSYLRGDAWVPFATHAVDDGTDALLASGIVTLAIPADATTEHTLLPRGLHWVRIAVASAPDAVCRLVTIAAQALTATSTGGSSPPGTITKLDRPDAAVKGVTQPFPAFGGRPAESTGAFATRVSERLRHKDRAIALWDYEHLILEAFPAIFQARCLNHTRYEPDVYDELAPGHVTVVTIPDLAEPDPRDPLRPYTSLRVLGEIHRFLAERMSCFATLHVRNPQFEEVRVALRVRFRAGVDETFHRNRLRTEITGFLSPWAVRGSARPTFNRTIHKSVIVDFVEERPYVDHVSDVHLFHRFPGVTGDGPDLEKVVGSRAISILVSAPSGHHCVTPIPSGQTLAAEPCACGPSTGVAGR
ncbi:baseplate J/gp47 family protein [Pseudonocardia sp. DLS-67]